MARPTNPTRAAAQRGRPTKLAQVVRHRPDGTPVTAADEVTERVRLGAQLEEACDSAGIDRVTLHNWRKAGGLARAKQAGGGRLTPAEAEYVGFLNMYERAGAEAEVVRLGIIMRAAEGGYRRTKTVERHVVQPDGTLTLAERTVTTDTEAPIWTAAAWWLERRIPNKYARRVGVGGIDSAGDVVPLGERADSLLSDLESFMAGAAAAAELATPVDQP